MGELMEETVAKSAPISESEVKVEGGAPPIQGIGEVKSYEELYNYFKIPEIDRTPNVTKKVETIYNWAKSATEGKESPDLTWEIASLRRRLGSPHIWETSYNQIYQYIKLLSQSNEVSNKLKEMEMKEDV